jgi:hypothetical protein
MKTQLNSMEQSSYWVAYSRSAGQEIPRILWMPIVHRRVHNGHWSLPWGRWVQYTSSYPVSLILFLIIFFHIRLGLPEWTLPFKFSAQYFMLSPIYRTCYMLHSSDCPHNNVLWRSALCSFLQPPAYFWIFSSYPCRSHCLETKSAIYCDCLTADTFHILQRSALDCVIFEPAQIHPHSSFCFCTVELHSSWPPSDIFWPYFTALYCPDTALLIFLGSLDLQPHVDFL